MKYGSGADVFAKIKGLVEDMIAKLEKEAQEDAEEKAYCDEEMKKAEAKKSELEEDLAKVTSKLEVAAANSAKLKEEVKEAQAQLAALATSTRISAWTNSTPISWQLRRRPGRKMSWTPKSQIWSRPSRT